ncbi:hypothetical protein V0288_22995 [Pannus brasiliensis CCIBt3594]|uniref:Uncharacterized protein n=1 Tax=Pannus brasiliensis CCIBt3594 TaxID=1427578 RepID=A0AAW9QXK4_9CHRO
MIQASDIFVGLMGKFSTYINTHSREEIVRDLDLLNEDQSRNLDSLLELIEKSDNKNAGFLARTDSYEELTKFSLIYEKINFIKIVEKTNKKIEDKSQCLVCKITNSEIDKIDDSDIHDIVIRLTSNLCFNHMIGYLESRKFGQLTGKDLLRSLKQYD